MQEAAIKGSPVKLPRKHGYAGLVGVQRCSWQAESVAALEYFTAAFSRLNLVVVPAAGAGRDSDVDNNNDKDCVCCQSRI